MDVVNWLRVVGLPTLLASGAPGIMNPAEGRRTDSSSTPAIMLLQPITCFCSLWPGCFAETSARGAMQDYTPTAAGMVPSACALREVKRTEREAEIEKSPKLLCVCDVGFQ